ncbi:hypothetical protein OOJ91_07825 [Micromonospora lupini]|uniref:hypothetical protein n=1 Tax=Micromonospora lupini TaxID=285679 RepID=UPI0022520F29|nr:hypothetical protein [Micromonospora lupini]MCX5065786.1 hypothetical protein [Micromonospora lupini]
MAGSVCPYDARARTLGALGDRESRDRLGQSAELPMRLVAGMAADPVGRGRLLEQGGQQETGPDGSRNQHHPPGEPAQSAGHERSRSAWRGHRRGSVDGTSHAGMTPIPSGLLTHSSDALT